MASCTTMTPREVPRPPTPTPRARPASVFRVITKKSSYQSLNSPVLLSPMSPVHARPFSAIELKSPSSYNPRWQDIHVISPSTASHRSVYSDNEESARSPRLQLLTSNLLGSHSQCSTPGEVTLISPSAQVQLPGDELLYDVADEERPNEKFFNTALQAALASAKKEMKDVSLALWGCTSSHQLGSDLHALKDRAQELSEFEPCRTRTVGLVGDPGTGKSSLINSLLDQQSLAQPNFVDACSTSIITEYRFRPTHFDESFSMEADYMTVEEIRELIDELLRTFKACHIPAFQDVNEVAERQEIRSRSEKAWQTLEAMYGNQTIFTRDFLLEYPSNARTPLSKVLEQWSATFLARRPGGSECLTWSATAFTLDECTDKLQAFTCKPIDPNTPALWPYIRVVRVYLRAALLQSGLMLVDCPTPRDLNFARARATERYLRNCHEIFAVTTVQGAVADEGVKDIIRRNNLHRPIRIICTKSEELTVREVERKEPEISLQARTWRQQIESLQRQVKRLEAQRRHGKAGAAEAEFKTRDMLHDLEFGLKKFLVERRNRAVATQLIEKYTSEVQDGDLKVFCVSNKDYSEHRYDEKMRAESRLALTGIVNLRKYCHSIPAAGQFDAASAFLENEVPALLGSLRQWALSGLDSMDATKASEVRQLMQSLEEIAIKKLVLPTAQIQMTRTSLNHEFADSVTLPIRELRREWRSTAIENSEQWAKLPTKDFASFCRHQGAHSLKTTGLRNWNSEIISPMRQNLESNWDFFAESIEDNKAKLLNSVQDVCNEITAPLKEKLEDSPSTLQNLIENMDARKHNIQHIITTGFPDILEGTQQLESDALHGHASSYINALMVPAYNAASIIASTDTSPSSTSSSSFERSSSSSSMKRTLSVSTTSSNRSRARSMPPPPTPTLEAANTAPAPRSRSRAPSDVSTTSNATQLSAPPARKLRPTSPSPSISTTPPQTPLAYDERLKSTITNHISSTRLFPKLASMIERSHRAFLRAAFDSMIASITKEVDAMIRDMGLVVPPEEVVSPSISRKGANNEDEDNKEVEGKAGVIVGKSEAQKYEEFSTMLRGRIEEAEKVVRECRRVVGAVRRGERVVFEMPEKRSGDGKVEREQR